MKLRRTGRGVACAMAIAVWACGDGDRHVPVTPAPVQPRHAPAEPTRDISALRAFEEAQRAATDFAALPTSDRVLGPDPYRVVRVPADAVSPAPSGAGGDRSGARGQRRAPAGDVSGPGEALAGAAAGSRDAGDGLLVGILRGASAVVVLDGDARELARTDAPRSPSGLTADGEGNVFVAGELEPVIAHYRIVRRPGGQLEIARRAAIALPGPRALRDIAAGPDGTLYAVDERRGQVLAVELERGRGGVRLAGTRELGRCHGPVHARVAGGWLAVNCLLDQTIEVFELEPAGAGDARTRGRAGPRQPVRIRHDGPMWSLALAVEPSGDLLVAAGGVENRPLLRDDGAFRYVDSFVYVYRVRPGQPEAEQLAEVNTSEHGAITPRWVDIARQPNYAIAVSATGYGGDRALTLTWRDGDFSAPPSVGAHAVVPGTAHAARAGDAVVYADPLLDAWVVRRGHELAVVPVEKRAGDSGAGGGPVGPRTVEARIGEALFFTSLMGPWNTAEGPASRFTCETCHFEGYVDGRVHFTGRGDVHAVTKPLLGLFNNRPHFSRALDRTLADMVHNEFRVASKKTGHDSWFSLQAASFPWLAHIPGAPEVMTPEDLRRSLMSFLMVFTHRPNPAVIGRDRFSAIERAGAAVFRDRCERCHRAQLVADDPATRVPFERWESLVMAEEGAIVWGDAAYQKTGVTPYVYDDGARTPSLRRLYKKHPYFTNGSARSVGEVLDRAAWAGDAFYHDGAPADAGVVRLDARERAALLAFLDLL